MENDDMEECLLKVEVPSSFNLEKAVCSHGLFMMSPNHWDPLSLSFSRPLHLSLNSPSSSVMVRIFQPQDSPNSLHVNVHRSTTTLSSTDKDTLLAQVARMLRLSETDEKNVKEFERVVSATEEENRHHYMKGFGGRVFRSPTMFEDMVKCMLLCNCQWPRALSMARALCELQWEIHHSSSNHKDGFIPTTPVGKDSKRKLKMPSVAGSKIARIEAGVAQESKVDCGGRKEDVEDNLGVLNEPYVWDRIGNFPTPGELANYDKHFLAKRCGLGYRAGRILKLAQDIVEGRIQLKQLEEVGNEDSLASYDILTERLLKIDGFGRFTCANVLVCMGFYHVIPSDSETIRHLEQVHARESSIKTVQKDVEAIYGKFAPYQFLAYWSELWHFYEQRFGKLSKMPFADYKLITASNMRSKTDCKFKKS